MTSLHTSFLPAPSTNQYIFIALLFVVGIFIKPNNHPKKDDFPEDRKKLLGATRSLQDQLLGSESARGLLERTSQEGRSALEEERKKTASLEKEIKSNSLYRHKLERELLNKRHRRR